MRTISTNFNNLVRSSLGVRSLPRTLAALLLGFAVQAGAQVPEVDLALDLDAPEDAPLNTPTNVVAGIANASVPDPFNASRADGTTFTLRINPPLQNMTATCTGSNGAVCSTPTLIAPDRFAGTATTLPPGGRIDISVNGLAPGGPVGYTFEPTLPPGINDPNPNNGSTGVGAVSLPVTLQRFDVE